MGLAAVCAGVLLVCIVLWETFETIVLPRTVIRRLRITRLYFLFTWRIYRCGALRSGESALRESYLSSFGPLSLLGLFLYWVLALIVGFALVLWGMGSRTLSPTIHPGFATDLYMSGTTFFTLGLGDVTPGSTAARACVVCEAGVGFGFLAVVIGYIPVIYASFSRRETGISLLDARAGSPPIASEMLLRHARGDHMESLTTLLSTFEAWASDVMESHLSYPVVAYYRSQHDRESWISALTAILDVCALIELGFENGGVWQKPLQWQARMTYAMARHAAVDLSLVFFVTPMPPKASRLPTEDFERLRARLAAGGLSLADPATAEARLAALRANYEPYVQGLADRLLMSLPPWLSDPAARDNWQTSAWNEDSHL